MNAPRQTAAMLAQAAAARAEQAAAALELRHIERAREELEAWRATETAAVPTAFVPAVAPSWEELQRDLATPGAALDLRFRGASVSLPPLPGPKSKLPAEGLVYLRALETQAARRELLDPGASGSHLSVSRPGYTHHCVYLGGRVVHYPGSPEGDRSRAISVTPYRDFLGSGADAGVRRTTLTDAVGAPLASLRGGVAALRALRAVDAGGYDLVRRNCEHFATWAQVGVPMSWQVNRVATLVGQHPSVRTRRDGWQRVRDTPDAEQLIDVARLYWDPERRTHLLWFPLWEPGGRPAAGAERAWAIGADAAGGWHRTCPSDGLDPNWHASLLRVGGRGFCWLDTAGRVARPLFDTFDVVERRLDVARRALGGRLYTGLAPEIHS